jgi:hypothetical protein
MDYHARITIQVLTAKITLKTDIATEKTVSTDIGRIVGSTTAREDVPENLAVPSSIEVERMI